MKLSSNSKAFIAAEVKAAFAEEYKKAEEAESAASAKSAAKWKLVQKDLDAVAERAKKEVMAVIRKHGLTIASKNVHEVFKVEFKMSDAYYSGICANTFEETADGCDNPEFREARRAVNAVENKIMKATSKALFEIEIRGRKSDLEKIVEEVIKSIKEGK